MKIEDIKLKPCPSCGKSLASIRYHPNGCHHIECNGCHFQTGKYGGEQSALVWNNQPNIEQMNEKFSKFQASLEKIQNLICSYKDNIDLEVEFEDGETQWCLTYSDMESLEQDVVDVIEKLNKETKL